MSDITIYGIPNCDTTKKAMAVLNGKGIRYAFHDYKQSGITASKLKAWSKKAGWEKIFNKRSTTWRELPEKEQQQVTGEDSAIAAMIAHNSIIKRPVIEHGDELIVGFDSKAINNL